MKTQSVPSKAPKLRDSLPVAGLRPVQDGMPDSRPPESEMECRRQFLAAAAALGTGSTLGAMGAMGASALWPGLARAQGAFPQRPIRYIVPVAAGGGSDMVGRTVTERWGQVLKQTFVVDNQGGGGGVIACQATARASPDGYTLMQGYVATHGTSPATRRLPYDAVKDFTPIGLIGATPNVLVVQAALPIHTVREFVAYVKKNPGRVSYGSAGLGSLTHLTMELFKQRIDSYMVHIPYRGVAPAFADLMGGQTQAMFPGLAAAMPHIRSGRVRALAVTGKQRHPNFKDLPTLEESGFPGFDAQQWYGVVGPAGIPAPIVRQLNESLASVLAMPDLREKLAVEAVEPQAMLPEQFGRFIQSEINRWTALARERQIQLDG